MSYEKHAARLSTIQPTTRWALLETWCFFWGHDWKSSWRQRTDYTWAANLNTEETKLALPYARRHSGNPYFEYSAGWHYRCRRCRRQTRNDAWYPLWREAWWAFKSFWRCWFLESPATGQGPTRGRQGFGVWLALRSLLSNNRTWGLPRSAAGRYGPEYGQQTFTHGLNQNVNANTTQCRSA